MPRLKPLFALCLMILTGTFVMVGQDDVTSQWLDLDMPAVFLLDGTSPAIFYYAGVADEVITITLRSLSDGDNPLNDPVLEIWGIDGRRMAYNNNTTIADENPKNARLADIRLPADGTYTLRADTYGGVYAGEFEILVVQSDPFQRIEAGDNITFYIPLQTIFTHTMMLEAGQVVTITAQSLSGDLDPFLWITAPDGSVLVSNDDHASNDLSLNILDARIADLAITQTGDYTIHVRDFLGRDGYMRLTITHENRVP